MSSESLPECQAIAARIRAEQPTVETVQESLKANAAVISSVTKKMADYEKDIVKAMEKRLEIFEGQKKRLFAFDNIRTALFWGGCISNVGALFLLIYFAFFRG